ncbi:hypothetical protein HNQ77_000861 [Silvibacterium bohemicum]|uniref:Uncharacterized protein n=1 Tax=Silvibacterium bohemicum TaxID=1577686 RepID=A0A841JQU4_9BACT|nr:hypothetical protein [Silvibacterium bohemicum]MBB6142917.1 hypothetical protein [Silvibacterium bohemicum]
MVNTKGLQLAGAERRLQDLEIVLPDAPLPLGAYVEAVHSGSLLFLSGMLPVKDGKLQSAGRLGKDLLSLPTQHRNFSAIYLETTKCPCDQY